MTDFERFFRLIQEFMERDVDFDLLEEFHRDLEDELCRDFFNTFQKTVELCHRMQTYEVPESLHVRLIEIIEHTPQEPPALPKRPSPRKRRPRR